MVTRVALFFSILILFLSTAVISNSTAAPCCAPPVPVQAYSYPAPACGPAIYPPPWRGCGRRSPLTACARALGACSRVCGACLSIPGAIMRGLLAPPRRRARCGPGLFGRGFFPRRRMWVPPGAVYPSWGPAYYCGPKPIQKCKTTYGPACPPVNYIYPGMMRPRRLFRRRPFASAGPLPGGMPSSLDFGFKMVEIPFTLISGVLAGDALPGAFADKSVSKGKSTFGCYW